MHLEERGGMPKELWARMHSCILCKVFSAPVTYKRGVTHSWNIQTMAGAGLCKWWWCLLPRLLSPCVSNLLPPLASQVGGTKRWGKELRDVQTEKWEEAYVALKHCHLTPDPSSFAPVIIPTAARGQSHFGTKSCVMPQWPVQRFECFTPQTTHICEIWFVLAGVVFFTCDHTQLWCAVLLEETGRAAADRQQCSYSACPLKVVEVTWHTESFSLRLICELLKWVGFKQCLTWLVSMETGLFNFSVCC